jgi:hypothetical protein
MDCRAGRVVPGCCCSAAHGREASAHERIICISTCRPHGPFRATMRRAWLTMVSRVTNLHPSRAWDRWSVGRRHVNAIDRYRWIGSTATLANGVYHSQPSETWVHAWVRR